MAGRSNPVGNLIEGLSRPIMGVGGAGRAMSAAGQSFSKGASLALKLDHMFEEEEARLQNNMYKSQQMLQQGLQNAMNNQFRQQSANLQERQFGALQEQRGFSNEIRTAELEQKKDAAKRTEQRFTMQALSGMADTAKAKYDLGATTDVYGNKSNTNTTDEVNAALDNVSAGYQNYLTGAPIALPSAGASAPTQQVEQSQEQPTIPDPDNAPGIQAVINSNRVQGETPYTPIPDLGTANDEKQYYPSELSIPDQQQLGENIKANNMPEINYGSVPRAQADRNIAATIQILNKDAKEEFAALYKNRMIDPQKLVDLSNKGTLMNGKKLNKDAMLDMVKDGQELNAINMMYAAGKVPDSKLDRVYNTQENFIKNGLHTQGGIESYLNAVGWDKKKFSKYVEMRNNYAKRGDSGITPMASSEKQKYDNLIDARAGNYKMPEDIKKSAVNMIEKVIKGDSWFGEGFHKGMLASIVGEENLPEFMQGGVTGTTSKKLGDRIENKVTKEIQETGLSPTLAATTAFANNKDRYFDRGWIFDKDKLSNTANAVSTKIFEPMDKDNLFDDIPGYKDIRKAYPGGNPLMHEARARMAPKNIDAIVQYAKTNPKEFAESKGGRVYSQLLDNYTKKLAGNKAFKSINVKIGSKDYNIPRQAVEDLLVHVQMAPFIKQAE